MSAVFRGPVVIGLALVGLALALGMSAETVSGQPPAGAQEAAVTFKDGLTYYGKVKREAEIILDQYSGQSIQITAATGAFILDDGPRWVLFSHKQVRDARSEADPRRDFVHLFRVTARPSPKPLPKNGTFDGETRFDPRTGRRQVFLRAPEGRYRIDQVMTSLTPYYLRLDAPYYLWAAYFLTAELGPDETLRIARQNPALAEVPGKPDKPGQPPTPAKPDIAKRLKLVRFLTQAAVSDRVKRDRWFELAKAELDRSLQDLPEKKEQIEAARAALKGLQADLLCNDAAQARKAGRARWAKLALDEVEKAYGPLDAKREARLVQLRLDAEAETKQFALATKFLDQVPNQIQDENADFACEALTTIRSELGPESASRLEAFVTQAQQAERERAQGKPVSTSPTELTALAVTGWLLGQTLAEARIATAHQLWHARRFLLTYLSTHDADERRRQLSAFQSANAPPFDVMAQMVTLLPPPEPGDAPDPASTVVHLAPLQDRRADLPACRTNPRYLLQLPPEYHPGRSYPLLIVLHNSGQAPMAVLKHWSEVAARAGFFVAAPEWGDGFTAPYKYREEDHQAVLDTLRDVRQHYRIDADRVFLAGFSQGANMALDVGLSHPDLFAGVATLGANLQRFQTQYYWRNAQHLPLYLVVGDLSGAPARSSKLVFNNWLAKGFPALMVIYKGRALEYFQGELPAMIDWMNAQRRQLPTPNCGLGPTDRLSQGEGFQSLREGDNRFYWLSADELGPRHQMTDLKVPNWGPARMEARIDGNRIQVISAGVKRLSIWLSKDMIDFDKPVRVTFNFGNRYRDYRPKPNLEVMLEDLYQRGDQQRPYVDRIECQPRN